MFSVALASGLAPTTRASSAGLSVLVGEKTLYIDAATIREWTGGRFNPPTNNKIVDASSALDILNDFASGFPYRQSHFPYTNYNPERIYTWVKNIAQTLDKEAVEPDMQLAKGSISVFVPPQNGQTLDAYNATLALLEALQQKQEQVTLPLDIATPNKTLANSNTLGISELLARGESNFAGSPNNRRHNIKVGIEKLKGILLPPGEEFSFNQNICPVNQSAGYLPELVILGEKGTVPEYGGGLCQVSSTLFRAVMNAGLPVTLRKNHSYAVQYYSPQGTDATTYCGGIDFKFTNDTPAYLLIWPYLKDANTLVFDFYGSKDSRQITVNKPVQYERKPDGSMKAKWSRTVSQNGQTREDVFDSIYLPPALFHKTQTDATPTSDQPKEQMLTIE